LLNDLGFNLCVAPQSPVVRLVAYFGVREVTKTEILRSRVKESEWTRDIRTITNGHLLFVMGALILQRVQKSEVR